MVTANEIRVAVRAAADWAIAEEPADAGMRARLFVACLQGLLEQDRVIATELERLRYPQGRRTAGMEGA